MTQNHYFKYLVEYGADTPQFQTALAEANIQVLQTASKVCTSTSLKKINAELKRRGVKIK